MKTTYLSILMLLALAACKKKDPEPPDFGNPHKITLGVKVNTASTSTDGIKTINIIYSGAHGEFTKERTFIKDSIHEYPLNWDTTFTAFKGGTVKYTVGVTGYNLKMYSLDDYTKKDTTFKVAEPDKTNMLEMSIAD
jgi:hypothetical protein